VKSGSGAIGESRSSNMRCVSAGVIGSSSNENNGVKIAASKQRVNGIMT
jgi:hypothetical protein